MNNKISRYTSSLRQEYNDPQEPTNVFGQNYRENNSHPYCNKHDCLKSNFQDFQGFSRIRAETPGGLVQTQTLEEWILTDLKSSGISDEIIALNVHILEGESAIEILTEHEIAQTQGNGTVAVNRKTQAILKRYEFAAKGGWVAYGTTIAGGVGSVAYFKPRHPRISFEKRKQIKYETPAKAQALPILPFVDDETAQKIYGKYRVTPQEEEPFWQVVWRFNLPISITEGLKKALLLIQEGYPAICLRGIANWHCKGTRELFPILQHFATRDRNISIVFDQDIKPKTIANVACQIRQLGQVLQNYGCDVFVTTWNHASGKGIDDAFVQEGSDWLDQTMVASLALDEWKQCGLKRQYFEIIRRLKTLSLSPDRDTIGGYLPELPSIEIGSVTVLAANTGSGKTVRTEEDTIRKWRKSGGNVLVLSMLNSLGKQIAQNANIPHISDYGDSRYGDFLSAITEAHGAALCVDSLRKIPDWFLSERPLLLVLDEVNQFFDHAIGGETLGSKQPEILDHFAEICLLCGMSGAIVIAEAEVHPRSLELIKTYSGSDKIRYFRHHRNNAPWQVSIGSGRLDGFMKKILLNAVAGTGYGEKKRFLIPTDSQASGKRIERRLKREFPTAKIVRVDSETNREGRFSQFFDSPDIWLEQNQPDFLIVSPSIKTGVSITWEGFDAVYAFFTGAVDPDGWLQMLGRYRPAVPRFVCVPYFVPTSGDESLIFPRAINRRLNQDRQVVSTHFAIEALTETDERRISILTAAQQYYCDMSALRGAQKAIARDYLISVLREVGHEIGIEEWGVCADEARILAEIREEIDREDANDFAVSSTCDSVEEAYRILSSECSLFDEIKAKKTLYCNDFPGIHFDDPEGCYWILSRKRGSMRRGVQMQAAIENLTAAKELDREQVEAVCTNEIGMIHRLPRNYIRAKLLEQSGILQFANRGSELRNSDPRCIAVREWAVRYRQYIRYYFGLTISLEYTDSKGRKRHTPIDICSKLLGKLNLELKAVKRVGARNDRGRIYQVAIRDVAPDQQAEAWEYRQKALEASRRRLAEICPINAPSEEYNSKTPAISEDWQHPESNRARGHNSEPITTGAIPQTRLPILRNSACHEESILQNQKVAL